MKTINNNILISEYSIFEEYIERKCKGILINTVNCEGFMGKGIALEFKIRFGNNYFNNYKKKCNDKKINIGKIDFYSNNNKHIINFPTKIGYKYPSKLNWISEGLDNLIYEIEKGTFDNEIIYIPKLGSSQGGLKWKDIFLLIKQKLLKVNNAKVKIIICEDYKVGKIEKYILKKLSNYNGSKIPGKILKNINNKSKEIKRLRDLLKVKGVGEKIYKEILNLNVKLSLF